MGESGAYPDEVTFPNERQLSSLESQLQEARELLREAALFVDAFDTDEAHALWDKLFAFQLRFLGSNDG